MSRRQCRLRLPLGIFSGIYLHLNTEFPQLRDHCVSTARRLNALGAPPNRSSQFLASVARNANILANGGTCDGPPGLRLHYRGIATLLEHDKTWYEERLPILEDRVRVRLGELSSRLGDADWLDGAFSAGDLLMVTVLRRLNGSGMLEKYPNLSAYVARGEARPAYKRAFADQLAVFTGRSPTG